MIETYAFIGFHIRALPVLSHEYGNLFYHYKMNLSDSEIARDLKDLYPERLFTRESVKNDRLKTERKLRDKFKKEGIIGEAITI